MGGFSLRCFQHSLSLLFLNSDMESWLTGRDPDAGKDWGQEEKVATENEMVE